MQDDKGEHHLDFKPGPLQEAWEAERERIKPYLLRQIEAAFDGVELGCGVSLHQARALDDYASAEEIRAARAADTEHRWQDVSDETLERLHDTLPFLDSGGFRFYIPRFMTFALSNESSNACDSAIYWTDTPERYARHLNLLSDKQRDAIEAFAGFFSEGREWDRSLGGGI